MYQGGEAIRGWEARKTLDSGFTGMGLNIVRESASKLNGVMTRGLPGALAKGDAYLEEHPPPWMKQFE